MLKRQLRYRTPIIVAVLLLVVAGGGLFRLSSQRRAPLEAKPPKLELLWWMAAGDVVSLELSRTGERVAIARPGGVIDCYDSTGKHLYRAKVEDADTVVLADDGDYAMAYARLDPLSERLTFLDRGGRIVWQMDVEGAVWSSDVHTVSSGAKFVVGTGERYIYVVDIGKTRKRYRRWRAPGAVTSAEFDSTGERILFGSWQDGQIGCSTTGGRNMWCRAAEPERLHFLHSLQAPDRLFLESLPADSSRAGEFSLLDASGQRISRGENGRAGRDRVMCSPNGRFVCVGYTRRIEHEGKSVLERHARLLDEKGRRVWDKGSMFFSAQPLVVTSKGCAVICNQKDALFSVGSTGAMEASEELTAPVLMSVVSDDASMLMLYCSDQRLSLFRIIQ